MVDTTTYANVKDMRARMKALRIEAAGIQADLDSAFLHDLVCAIEPVCEEYETNLADAIDLLSSSL